MNLDNWWLNAFWSVIPTVMVGLIFWFVIRAILNADRKEREVFLRVDAEERAKVAREEPPE